LEANSEQPQALTGIRIIELPCLDRVPILAAAMAAKAFAALGAEVVKVEPPRAGAPERHEGPFKAEIPDPETGGLHLYLNTNKLGVTLDIASEKGRELLARLLESADILLNPNMPALSERLGLDWRTLTARFPRLIVVSLTSFGADSPYRDARGGNLVATHMSGVGYETPINQVTDPPNQPPLKPAGRQADYLAGFTGAAAAMCALFHRKRTGKGQHVDASLWLAMVSMIRPSIGVYSHDTPDAPYGVRIRTRDKIGVPWLYPCQDGWVSFSPLTDKFWRGTKAIMGNPEWAEAEIFATLTSRASNFDAVEASLIDWLTTQKKQEVFIEAQAAHVPCFPVNTPREVADNPHYKARGFFVDHEHPVAREVRMPGAPCMFSRTPWRIVRGAPRLGEHNRRIFVERLGMAESEIDALSRDGVI
jgi:crotonobetainyl-CoA:carnitine CoA-transferase CaiB-like acyl-CoA transferase